MDDWKFIVGIGVPILAAVIGYLYNLRLSERRDNLDRINRQLSELYGPLLSLLIDLNAVYSASQKHIRANPRKSNKKRDIRSNLWFVTVKNAFMPIHDKIMDLIMNKADLLIEGEIPPMIRTYCEHVASMRIIVRQWEQGDYSEMRAKEEYPAKEMMDYADDSYKKLKERQLKLLGESKAETRSG